MRRAVIATVVLAVIAGCTLILDTKNIVKNCTSGADCDDGFDCVDNACLPADEASEGEGDEGQ